MNYSRLIVPHSRSCFMKGKGNPWSGLTDGHYWGNYAGTKNVQGDYHIWHRVTCNDPKCKGIKIVHSSVLSNA